MIRRCSLIECTVSLMRNVWNRHVSLHRTSKGLVPPSQTIYLRRNANGSCFYQYPHTMAVHDQQVHHTLLNNMRPAAFPN